MIFCTTPQSALHRIINHYRALPALGIALMLLGCDPFIKPNNPDLLNPPDQTNTSPAFVRLANVFASTTPLRLVMEGATTATTHGSATQATVSTVGVGFGMISPPVNVFRDSAVAAIVQAESGNPVFTSPAAVRLLPRPGFHTLVYVDSRTLIALPTNRMLDLTRPQRAASLRLLNAVPDTNSTFSLVFGCPGNAPNIANIPFRSVSGSQSFDADSNAVITLVQSSARGTGHSTVLQTASFVAEEFANYTAIVAPTSPSDARPRLYLLDDRTNGNSWIGFRQGTTPQSGVRLLNLSRQSLSVVRGTSNTILRADGGQNTAYNFVPTCGASAQDVLTLVGSGIQEPLSAALEIGKLYAIVAADSGSRVRGVVVPPLLAPSRTAPSVRFLNMAAGTTIAFIVGAQAQSGSRGRALANVRYGELSGVVELPQGLLPLMLFTTNQPQVLLKAVTGSLTGGKQYLVVAHRANANDPLEVSIVDETESRPARLREQMPDGALVQVVNAFAGTGDAPSSVQVALRNGDAPMTLGFTETLTTVMPPGRTTVSASQNREVMLGTDSNTTIIITGGTRGIEPLVVKTPTLARQWQITGFAPRSTSVRRLFNAAVGVDSLFASLQDTISRNAATMFFLIDEAFTFSTPNAQMRSIGYGNRFPLRYGEITREPRMATSENRNTFVFWQPAANMTRISPLLRVENVLLPFGTSHIVIFTRGRGENRFTTIFLQEH